MFYKLAKKRDELDLEDIRDHTEHEYFKSLSTLWDTVEEECDNVELKGETDWKMPAWAEGVFVTSGPSKQGMGH